MALELRSFSQVLKSLIDSTTNRTLKITDFNVGSAIRTLYEAIALQFEEFYFSMKQNIIWTIENAVYEAFDFFRKDAVAAYGDLTIVLSAQNQDLIIRAGEIFSTGPEYGTVCFKVMTDIYVPTGCTVYSLPVECTTGGVIGNVPAYSINRIVSANSEIRSVFNDKAFTTGKEYETAIERKARFKEYIQTLGKGTARAVQYGILSVDEVAGCTIDDRYIGYCIAYVHNSDGELPDELKETIQSTLLDYRSAGIEVLLQPVRIIKVNLTFDIMLEDAYDISTYNTTIAGLITDYLNSFATGDSLYISHIIHTIQTAFEEEVINIRPINASDISCDIMELIKAGTVTVNCKYEDDWEVNASYDVT